MAIIDIVKPGVTLIPQENGWVGMLKHIEKIGRVSHRSEGGITEDSYAKFVENIIKLEHLSCIRHGTIYYTMPVQVFRDFKELTWEDNPYVDTNIVDNIAYVTTNYQYLLEHPFLVNIEHYMEESPCEHHIPRLTFEVITSIGVSREGNRHKDKCAA